MNGGTDNSTWQDYDAFHVSRLGLDDGSSEDIEKLYKYILCHNPGQKQLEDHLQKASNWNNHSWVEQLIVRMDGPANGNNLAHSVDYYVWPCGTTVHGCFSKDTAEQCQLYFSLPICLAVVVCNIIKVICMYLTARTDRTGILLTVGDALSSFLDKPDQMTRGRCFLSRHDMMGGKSPWCPDAYTSDTTELVRFHQGMPYPSTQPNGYSSQCLPPQPTRWGGRKHKRYPDYLPKRGLWVRSAGWVPWTWTLGLYVCIGVT